MKRSTVAIIALLLIASAALYAAWNVFNGRLMTANLEQPTAAFTAEPVDAERTPVAQSQPTEPAAGPTAPPSSPTVESLSAILDIPDPAYHPAHRPLIVVFNRPVTDPPDRPLVFEPTVPGAFAWSEGGTTLTFAPSRGFVAGRDYTITAVADLLGADGTAFDAPPSWTLAVVEPPRVTTRRPPGGRGSDRRPAFTLAFNRAMARDTVTVTVDPAVPLEISWTDDATLVVQPSTLLDPGVAYDFAVAPEAADTRGATMAGAYRFRYTPAAIIAAVEGPTRADPDAPLVVRFGYPMDRASVEAALTVEPPIDAAYRWPADDALEFIDPPLLGNTEYAFGLSTDVRDAAGESLPAPAAPVTYRSLSPIREIAPTGNGIHPGVVLTITFDRPMDPATTADAFAVSPPIVGEITWPDDHTLIFTPDGGYWEAVTQYEITVGTSATDAGGRPVLGEAAYHTFTTGEERRVADFGIGPLTQVLDADGRRAVQFQSAVQSSQSISFDLLPVDQTGFLNRLVGDVTSGWSAVASPMADNGLLPIASWTTETTAANPDLWGNPQETLVPADAPPGLYLLRLNGPTPAHLLLALTRMTLVAKMASGEMVVWVTDIPRLEGGGTDPATTSGGEGIVGAAVQLYAQNGRLLAEGTTDERGVARLPLDAGEEPYVVFARSGTDTTFSALTPELQARGEYFDWWWGEPRPAFAPPAFAVHVQTDRPIYRPGQTVFYKSIVRLDDDGVVSLPPAGTQVIVRLRDSRDNVVLTKWLATDDFGAVYDAFDVAEGAMLGEYAVEVEPIRPGGGSDPVTRQTFQVEEYRKPDYSVTVTPAAPTMLSGDVITVTVDAQYLFGEPVAGARVSLKRFRLYDYYDYWSDSEPVWEEWYEEAPLSAITGPDGRAVLTVPAIPWDIDESAWAYNPDSWRMAVEATINDGSNQTVSASTIVTIHRASEALTLETPGYFVEFGEEAPFTATVTTTISEPGPVAGRQLRGTLQAWSEQTYSYSEIVADFTWETGPDGVISAHLTPPAPGYYRLRLTGADENGRLLRAETYVYVLGEGESPYWGQPSLTVSADRDSYAPGDTARLIIRTPFAGPGLITFERAAVRREMPVTLTPPVTVVEVPILPEDAPNIHATVNAWEPILTLSPATDIEDNWRLTESQRDAALHTATVELLVPVTDRTLTVAITTDREVYAPRDEAAVAVRVTNAAGQPVRAQVALAMVDEAIFLLADDNTRPLHDAFYGRRPNRVLTRDAMAPGRYLHEGGFGGGGGGVSSAPRSDFPDTAAWFPALLTDANGEIRLTIPLADSLTTWRLTARAVTAADTSVGEAVHTITTHQDIIVRPILPRGLTVGDDAVLSAVVHNYGDAATELTVTLSDEAGLLAVADPSAQMITLEPGQTRVVGWPVAVATAGETRALVTAVDADGGGDAVELPLSARELAVPIFTYATGVVDGAGEIVLTPPADALPSSKITLEVSRSPAGTLLNGLEYLIGFPYGCVEQTMSRALPNAVVSRAFSRLGAEPPAEADLDTLVNESAQRLYGFQHDDGGWGWWFDDDSDPYQTAWVLFGLGTMAEAGHEIDPGVIGRAITYLRRELDSADPRTRAYMLYSLAVVREFTARETISEDGTSRAEDGSVEIEAALALLNEFENGDDPRLLDAFALAALALTLDAHDRNDAAQTVLDRLAETVEIEGDTAAGQTAHWGITGDGLYDRKTMASATRSTALALSAFVRLRPDSELEPLIVNYLMGRRRGDGWGTTNETAHAVIGLTDHLLNTGLGETTATYTVTLNGEPLTNGLLEANELRDVIEIPFDALRSGDNTLAPAASDGGRLYYTLSERYQAARATIAADGVIVVERRYSTPDGDPVTEVAPGDLVEVRLTVRAPRNTHFVVVEDRVPAGLEPLNERLNTAAHIAEPPYWDQNWQLYRWQQYGYNHKEIRDGRVSFFVTVLPVGTSVFEYTARATHEGTFVALPAEAWAMYELETWGRSGSDVVRVATE